MLSSNLNIIKDDGVQHIYRIVGTANSIKRNPLFPQIMSDFCNGFGYSWNIFYSPLTAFLPLIFRSITSSYIVILKMFMFCLMLFSGIFMNKLVLQISESRKASLLSAIIYMLAPYHLTDMYSRIAIAELASFTFLPIVFMGLHDIFEKQTNKSYYLSIGMSGLILTHNVITLYAVIFCFFYCIGKIVDLWIYNKVKFPSGFYNIIKKVAINILITVLLTSFYWLPLVEHYFATDYEVFKTGRMYDTKIIEKEKLTLKQILYEQRYDKLICIGLPSIIGIFAFFIIRKNSKNKKIMQIFLLFGLISVIMSSQIFPFQYLPNIFKMIQFPWRMMEFSNFFFAIVAGISIFEFCKNNLKKEIIFILILLIFIIFSVFIYLNKTVTYTNYTITDKPFLTSFKVNENTKYSHPGCASFEYLPTKAYKNYSYIITRTDNAILTRGKANIGKFTKNEEAGNVDIIMSSEDTVLELPYIYYLGYKITLTENEECEVLEYKESEKGFIEVNLPNGLENAKLQVKYTGTILTKISYILSIVGIIVLCTASIKFS